MQYRIEPHDLSEIVRTAVAESECKAGERRLSIRAIQPEPVPVACDHDRVLQVMENLLENAIKFSPGSGTIEVSTGRAAEMAAGMPAAWRARLRARPAQKEYAAFAVADRGPGIPDEQKEKIFEKFHQTGATAKVTGQGVGLGLAIARTIVEAHCGAIWVEDNPGGGSRFVVLLPSGEMKTRAGAVSAPI
jgi:signal transduction histidine kinase